MCFEFLLYPLKGPSSLAISAEVLYAIPVMSAVNAPHKALPASES